MNVFWFFEVLEAMVRLVASEPQKKLIHLTNLIKIGSILKRGFSSSKENKFEILTIFQQSTD